jgi:hypothetical protein
VNIEKLLGPSVVVCKTDAKVGSSSLISCNLPAFFYSGFSPSGYADAAPIVSIGALDFVDFMPQFSNTLN